MAFVIVTIRKILDQAAFDEYAQKVKPILESFGARYVAIERDHETKAGEWPYVRTVVVEFPSLERAQEWYSSEIYREIIPIRQKGIDANIIMVRGLEETKAEKRAAQ